MTGLMRNLSNLVTGAVAIVACMQCDHQMATSRSYFQLFAIPLNRASLRLTLDVYVAQKRLRSEIRVITDLSSTLLRCLWHTGGAGTVTGHYTVTAQPLALRRLRHGLRP